MQTFEQKKNFARAQMELMGESEEDILAYLDGLVDNPNEDGSKKVQPMDT